MIRTLAALREAVALYYDTAQKMEGTGPVTVALLQWKEGDDSALVRLSDAVYRELRRIAGSILSQRSQRQIIQPTELVHELYFRLPGVRQFDFNDRTQFLSVAAKMMRRILVDHARQRNAAKRGGGAICLTASGVAGPGIDIGILEVHLALERLTVDFPRHARVVELRFFGGLTAEETVEVLQSEGVTASLRTIERDWSFAKAWLQNAVGLS